MGAIKQKTARNLQNEANGKNTVDSIEDPDWDEALPRSTGATHLPARGATQTKEVPNFTKRSQMPTRISLALHPGFYE